MPISTVNSGDTISAAYFNAAFALCVLTDTAKTITVSHTYTASQTFTGGWTAGAACTVTAADANAVAVGRLGTSNPTLQVDTSTASVATGLKVKGAAAGSGLALSVISSGTNEALSIDAKGSGTITIGNTSTGGITLARAVTASLGLTVTTGGLTVTAGTLTLSDTGTSMAAAGDISVVSGKKVALNVGKTNYLLDDGVYVGSTKIIHYGTSLARLDAAAIIGGAASAVGFYNSAGATKQTVSGSRGSNAALASLLTTLNALGLITDSSTI